MPVTRGRTKLASIGTNQSTSNLYLLKGNPVTPLKRGRTDFQPTQKRAKRTATNQRLRHSHASPAPAEDVLMEPSTITQPLLRLGPLSSHHPQGSRRKGPLAPLALRGNPIQAHTKSSSASVRGSQSPDSASGIRPRRFREPPPGAAHRGHRLKTATGNPDRTSYHWWLYRAKQMKQPKTCHDHKFRSSKQSRYGYPTRRLLRTARGPPQNQYPR